MEKQHDPFKFQISLSVLNHLGRNLYRNFITVIGEAISNSWDADANNVWITINKEKNYLIVQDDGIGMNENDFQDKFLKVGYSKRKIGGMNSPEGRPYIGAKGIGKLALLSCADVISIATKSKDKQLTGGTINNSKLDEEIANDKTSEQYTLEPLEMELWDPIVGKWEKGTMVIFQNIKENIRNTIPHLRNLIALYFRFSLIDNKFNIHVNGETVTLKDISDLCDKTEFLWSINEHVDPIYKEYNNLLSDKLNIEAEFGFKGFIATVIKPRFLKITGTEEKAGIDLFVNGRLRERDILKHLPDYSTRFIASYLYGQIHFDELDSDLYSDRFTSSREGVVPGDPLYNKMIELLKNILEEISDKWDELRLIKGKPGDNENPRLTKKERSARDLFNLSSDEYKIKGNDLIDKWVVDLRPDADFNIPAYVDCFLSENLIRRYIIENKIPYSASAKRAIKKWEPIEKQRLSEANISFDIRQNKHDLSYVAMFSLAETVDDSKGNMATASLVRDAIDFTPMRNVVGHTGLLTKVAKQRLNLVYENIKSRLKTILNMS